ncbi:MAG: hypothetical protein ACREV8_15520 [Gammaproteobacteria bacterium]
MTVRGEQPQQQQPDEIPLTQQVAQQAAIELGHDLLLEMVAKPAAHGEMDIERFAEGAGIPVEQFVKACDNPGLFNGRSPHASSPIRH